MKLSKTGVGTTDNANDPIYDPAGSGMLPVQAKVTGTASYRINGRAASDAPWVEVRPADIGGFLESWSLVPWLQLEVLSGTGTVELWIGDAA